MKPFRHIAIGLILLGCTFASSSRAADNASRESVLGKQIDELSLSDFGGKPWSLADAKESKLVVVAFLGTECPLAASYAARLVELSRKYGPKGVAFVGVDSNQQDSLAEMAHFARTQGIEFPLLKDPGNVVADRFSAQRTPEVFVLDIGRAIRYRGRIDDQFTYGIQRPKATRHDLAAALDELLAGKEVSTRETEVVGCHIGRVFKSQSASDVTYSKQISRIFQNRCVECHRAGEIGPFSLTSYDDAVGWAEMIDEVVREGRMPPWHADPKHGKFANDARLSDEEKEQIHRWVVAGAPEGNKADLPPPREFVEGWRIGTPDLVVKMSERPFQVPAKGEVSYKYFIVDPGFKEDKWIKAAECRPGNRAVVHHILVGAAPGDVVRPRVQGEMHSEFLAATAPGARPLMLPDGLAKHIPAGSKLVFQMHYTPNGKAQEDLSSVGLIFADPKTVKRQVATHKAATRNFRIPPGDANYKVESDYTFAKDALLLALFPHMHLRGKSFSYTAHYPDGREEILLDVPRYDFNWQNSYEYPEPKQMPAGTKIHCVAHFDNSERNLANPDPTKVVRWGDQTWEEMMIGYFDVALAEQDLTKAGTPARTQEFVRRAQTGEVKLSDRARELVPKALASSEALDEFALELRKAVPQLDRICWTTISDGKLEVRLAAQELPLRRALGGKGVTVGATGLALTKHAESSAPVVHDKLSASSEFDLKFMSRGLASSLHVPVKIGGTPGTLNFWSTEPAAFPAPAVALLEEAAKLMAAGE
jgi:peroxiredoxin